MGRVEATEVSDELTPVGDDVVLLANEEPRAPDDNPAPVNLPELAVAPVGADKRPALAPAVPLRPVVPIAPPAPLMLVVALRP